jgi:enamine deaminase RidA (YjgF/YER057c/UK114 family)
MAGPIRVRAANKVTGAEQLLYCVGQTSVDGDGNPVHVGQMQDQALQAIDSLEAAFAKRASSWPTSFA